MATDVIPELGPALVAATGIRVGDRACAGARSTKARSRTVLLALQ